MYTPTSTTLTPTQRHQRAAARDVQGEAIQIRIVVELLNRLGRNLDALRNRHQGCTGPDCPVCKLLAVALPDDATRSAASDVADTLWVDAWAGVGNEPCDRKEILEYFGFCVNMADVVADFRHAQESLVYARRWAVDVPACVAAEEDWEYVTEESIPAAQFQLDFLESVLCDNVFPVSWWSSDFCRSALPGADKDEEEDAEEEAEVTVPIEIKA